MGSIAQKYMNWSNVFFESQVALDKHVQQM